jgi:undecaprenyl-diphosphatase
MDLFNGMDWGAYNSFRYAANRLPEVNDLMRLISGLGSLAVNLVVLVSAVLIMPQSRRTRLACAVVMTFLLGAFINEGVNGLTHRSRPSDAENVLRADAMYSSFPSRGVMMAAFAWLMLALALERRFARRAIRVMIYAVAALAIVLVCVSQLWLGLHWVSDVLAGLAGGLGLALIGRWAAEPAGFGTPHTVA